MRSPCATSSAPRPAASGGRCVRALRDHDLPAGRRPGHAGALAAAGPPDGAVNDAELVAAFYGATFHGEESETPWIAPERFHEAARRLRAAGWPDRPLPQLE